MLNNPFLYKLNEKTQKKKTKILTKTKDQRNWMRCRVHVIFFCVVLVEFIQKVHTRSHWIIIKKKKNRNRCPFLFLSIKKNINFPIMSVGHVIGSERFFFLLLFVGYVQLLWYTYFIIYLFIFCNSSTCDITHTKFIIKILLFLFVYGA